MFYVTTATNHPGGAGYWEVEAATEEEAHKKAMDALAGRWAFMYSSLEDVHPMDRFRHGRIS